MQALDYRLDVDTLHRDAAATRLELNQIGRVRIRTQQPLFFDAYRRKRATGCFTLVDETTNNTVAAGMISGPADEVPDAALATGVSVSPAEAVEVTEVRAALEGLCAAKAATRLTDDVRDRLRTIGTAMRDAVAGGDLSASRATSPTRTAWRSPAPHERTTRDKRRWGPSGHIGLSMSRDRFFRNCRCGLQH